MRLLRRLSKRGSIAAFAVASSVLGLRASDLAGTVTDTSNRNGLPGATVTVVESGRVEDADAGGRFRFTGLTAGTYHVRVDYIGYDSKTQTVTVPDTGEASLSIVMGSDVVSLDKFTVEGFREGRSRALQQKQNATNVSDIISADAIGNLPDRNVAEAVARLPGVNLSLDQGEGRYVSIRGAEPNLNQVLMDGATMSAPGGTRLGRAVPLDTLSAGQIAQIEVIKSVTPDLDANSVGGTLNIKSTSAFDHQGRFLVGSVTGNRNGATTDNNVGGQITYSDTFGPNNAWGVAASASFDKRNYSNEWLQVGSWNTATFNGNTVYVPTDFEIKPETGNQKRQGLNLNFEYRPNSQTQFYIRPGYSAVQRWENTFENLYTTSASAANLTLTSARSGTFTSGTRTERREFRSRRDQELFNVATGMKKSVGAFSIEPMLTFSSAKEDRVFDNSRQFRNANNNTGPISFDLGDGFIPVRWDVDPAVDTPNKYSLRRTRDDFGSVDEDTFTAKTDVRWNFDKLMGNSSGYLKVGGKYLQRKRSSDLESRRLVPVGTWNLGQTGPQRDSVKVYDDQFNSLFLLNWDGINNFIASNPALVTHDLADEAVNSIEDDYQIKEYIYSGYGMGSVTTGKLTLLAGVRWEKTDANIRSVYVPNAGGVILGRFPISGPSSYDKFFPNLQAVYRFTNTLLIRGAFTETIGRPAYEDARPLTQFRYDTVLAPLNPAYGYTGTLAVGNPNLKPYFSHNFDFSLEWYVKNDGILSVAAFRKDIDDPIYNFSESQQNVVYNGVGLQSLSISAKRNGQKGKISGLEFNAYQPLRYLPAPFNGFGVEANLTLIRSSEVIPTRPGENILFFRQPSKIANATVFYEYRGMSARVAWTYAGEQIYTLGSSVLNDVYLKPRKQYDTQIRYRFSPNYAITASVRNLTREPEDYSYGLKNLLRTSRILDRDYRISVDFNF